MTLLGATRSSSPQWKGNDLAPARTSYGLTPVRKSLRLFGQCVLQFFHSFSKFMNENTLQATSKMCSRCKRMKEILLFGKNKGNRDGLNYECKECQKKYYEENKEKIAIREKNIDRKIVKRSRFAKQIIVEKIEGRNQIY